MQTLDARKDGRSDARAPAGELPASAVVDVPASAGEVRATRAGDGEGGCSTARVAISVPLRTGRGQNDREHWAAKARRVKAERQGMHWGMVTAAPGRQRFGSLLPCTVTLTRVAPSAGLDGDNLQGSLKACRDGVADWLGVDDRDPRVTWHYEQRRGGRGEYAVEVSIT